MLCSTQGVCGMTGKSIGGKKSSRKVPRSLSFQVKPVSWVQMKSCISLHSSGHRKLPGWFLSMIAACSRVYRGEGTNFRGWGLSFGMFSSGLLMIFRIIRKQFGKSVMTGQTLSVTGLYFFFVWIYVGRLSVITLEGGDEVLFDVDRTWSTLFDVDRTWSTLFALDRRWVSVHSRAVEACERVEEWSETDK
jgi:hypothetical protein